MLFSRIENGSRELKQISIAYAEPLWPFIKHCAKDHGLDFHDNEKAYMTAPLIQTWLLRIDSFIGRDSDCQVVLLIDICSADRTDETLPTPQHTKIKILTSSTTTKL